MIPCLNNENILMVNISFAHLLLFWKTGAEQHETDNIPMQRPATISYSEDNSYPTGLPILYRDKSNNDQQKLVK